LLYVRPQDWITACAQYPDASAKLAVRCVQFNTSQWNPGQVMVRGCLRPDQWRDGKSAGRLAASDRTGRYPQHATAASNSPLPLVFLT
jgi:hypothetical protein